MTTNKPPTGWRDWRAYWKAIVAAVGFVAVVGVEVVQAVTDASADGSLTTDDIITIVIVGATAFGVWAKRNEGYANPEPPAGAGISKGDV